VQVQKEIFKLIAPAPAQISAPGAPLSVAPLVAPIVAPPVAPMVTSVASPVAPLVASHIAPPTSELLNSDTPRVELNQIGENDLLILSLRDKNGNILRALVDCGSSHDFLKASAAKLAQVSTHTDRTKSMTVTLGDNRLFETPVVKTDPIALQFSDAYAPTRRYHVLENLPYDVVLGKPWLRSVNPLINWETHEIHLRDPLSKKWHLFSADASSEHRDPPVSIQLMSAKQFTRSLKNSESALYVVMLRPTEDPVGSAEDSPIKAALDSVCSEFADVFAPPHGLPPRREIDHKIEIVPGTDYVPSRHTYRLSQPELAELRKQLETLIEEGWIRPSLSPYGAPVLFAKKKNGGLRLCIDYRALNKLTVKNKYSLPMVSDIFDRLHGAKYFTSIDLFSGYHQVRLNDEDIHKTAFNTRYGHFEWLVLCFGLTNAPSTFQRLMNDIFRDLLDDFVVVYLDDILIFSRTKEDHIKHVRIVLERLRANSLHANPSKCHFGLLELEYLGFVVSEKGVSPAPSKVSSIQEWPIPRNQSEVRQFLGLCNYLSQHIPKYAHTASVLMDLTKKDSAKVDWTQPRQAAFDKLKYQLTHAPTLALPDFSRPFIITCDASLFAIGMMLSQIDENGVEHPVAFGSRKLTSAEKNYPTHDRECFAIVHSVTLWRHYIQGQPTIVYTDHASLLHLQSQKNLNQRQIRWLFKLQDFDLKFVHLPGRLNTVADALSRRPDYTLNAIKSTLTISDPVVHKDLLASYADDKHFASILADLKKPTPPPRVRNYSLNSADGLLYLWDGHYQRLCVPNNGQIRTRLLSEFHDTPTSAHRGRDATVEKLSRSFYWPKMSRDVARYVSSCDLCQRVKSRNRGPTGFLRSIDIPSEPWETITMDFITHLPPTTHGYDAVMVVVDKLTKRAHFIATHDKASASDTAELYISRIFAQHGLSQSIISDRDSKFVSDFWKTLFTRLGTRLRFSTANHPQTDGQTERMNRTLEEMLRCYVTFAQNDWDTLLPLLEFAYNDSLQTSTGYTPFYLEYGRNPRSPRDLLTDVAPSAASMLLQTPHALLPSDSVHSTDLAAVRAQASLATPLAPVSGLWSGAQSAAVATALGVPSPAPPPSADPLAIPGLALSPTHTALSAAWSPASDGSRPPTDLPDTGGTAATLHRVWVAFQTAQFQSFDHVDCPASHLCVISVRDPAEAIRAGLQAARDAIRLAQYRQAVQYDKGRNGFEFAVGDQVLVDVRVLPGDPQNARPAQKLALNRTGPFRILEKLSPTTYRLELPPTYESHNVLNISSLSPYVPDAFPNRVDPPPLPVLRNGAEEHFVEKILDHKRPRGRYFNGYKYFVKWEGLPQHESTWEPRAHLCDPRDNVPNVALLEYERAHNFVGTPPAAPDLHRSLVARGVRR
jgi:hypothetical protein